MALVLIFLSMYIMFFNHIHLFPLTRVSSLLTDSFLFIFGGGDGELELH